MSGESHRGAEISLQVNGMTCAMCVKHVARALENVPGVSRVEVTLAPPRAVVRYDPVRTSSDALIAAVRAEGYDASS